ncbi:inorganic diphosphatase [Buchnera aphidicola (Mollitrichosiphum nigrofasciatum)]|uniref:inorganic diphosphatase n=1 Tax=Buchnera aphidicola TaxID=9 RepID=UPI0031B8A5AB
MNFKNIPTGLNVPKNIYVIIEIPALSKPVKYEIDYNTGITYVDRFIPSTLFYPCNYGYINNTLSLDNDPLDSLVLTPYPIQTQSVILCRPVGILNMEDESGHDSKIISVPHEKISKKYKSIKDIHDFPKTLLQQIKFFFENYKKLEKNKWVKVIKWEGVNAAKKEILESIKRAKKK